MSARSARHAPQSPNALDPNNAPQPDRESHIDVDQAGDSMRGGYMLGLAALLADCGVFDDSIPTNDIDTYCKQDVPMAEHVTARMCKNED